MCSWAVTAVVDHFLSNKVTVFGAAMDMSKAFDLVEWHGLYTKLMARKVSPILLRILLFIYRNQECQVQWAGEQSQSFSVSDGVR